MTEGKGGDQDQGVQRQRQGGKGEEAVEGVHRRTMIEDMKGGRNHREVIEKVEDIEVMKKVTECTIERERIEIVIMIEETKIEEDDQDQRNQRPLKRSLAAKCPLGTWTSMQSNENWTF